MRRWPYDAADGRVVMFGGHAGSAVFSDTWVWVAQGWTELQPDASPPGRKHAAMAYDQARQEVVLFGGADQADWPLGDTWVLDGQTWTQRLAAVSPPISASASMAYDPIREEVVLFGVGERGRDTWVWDGAAWEQRFPSVVPPGRTSFGMAWDRSRAAVILFGGFQRGGELDDTWAWNGETWSELELDRRPPGAGNMSMSSFGSQAVRFGGLTGAGYSDDTWVLKADRWKGISTGAARRSEPAGFSPKTVPSARPCCSVGMTSGQRTSSTTPGCSNVDLTAGVRCVWLRRDQEHRSPTCPSRAGRGLRYVTGSGPV